MIPETGSSVFFGPEQYPYPSTGWNKSEIEDYVSCKISSLEKNFMRKGLQYENLVEEFEVFRMDEVSDSEEMAELGEMDEF